MVLVGRLLVEDNKTSRTDSKGAWAYDKKLKYVRRYIITALNHEERD